MFLPTLSRMIRRSPTRISSISESDISLTLTIPIPTDRGVDMVISRWPVKTAAEFLDVAQKMKNYDAGGSNSSWRNLITLIADDQNHPTDPPTPPEASTRSIPRIWRRVVFRRSLILIRYMVLNIRMLVARNRLRVKRSFVRSTTAHCW